MFFKREKKDKPKSVAATEAPPQTVTSETSDPPSELASSEPPREETAAPSAAPSPTPVVAAAPKAPPVPATLPSPLKASDLRRRTDPAALGFKTTAEVKTPAALPGQDQALAAIASGLAIAAPGHNVVVVGATSPAAVNAVRNAVHAAASRLPPPSDWVYVANFDEPYAPHAIELPAGHGRLLASAMDEAIGEMRSAIFATLSSDSYQTRWRAIDAEFQARHQEGFEALMRAADARSIALLRTPTGYAVAPAHAGAVVSHETFNSMPPTMQADVRAQISAIEAELAGLLETAPQVDRLRRARLLKLNRDVVASVVRAALAEPRHMFAATVPVMNFLAAVEADAVANAGELLPTVDIPDIIGAEQFAPAATDTGLERYRVNAFVGRAAELTSAPVVEEFAPHHASLFGGIAPDSPEKKNEPPHMRLVPGLLHRSNGGFLMLEARALTAASHVWSAFLTVLNAGAIRPAAHEASADSQVFAQAVPLDLKIVLLCDAEHLEDVLTADPRFSALFKADVRLAETVERSAQNEKALAKSIAALARERGLAPLDAEAVACLIEIAARMADNRDELRLAVDDLLDIALIADGSRAAASRKVIGRDDVVAAWASRAEPKKAGKVPQLEVLPAAGVVVQLSVGSQNGSAPVQRVGARVQRSARAPASITVTRIGNPPAAAQAERAIAAYLAAEFGHDGPVALAAAIDSDPQSPADAAASCAEIVALLSAVADKSLPQTIAIAGSFDQFGGTRCDGPFNEAIESFYDATRTASAGKGERGVVIPAAAISKLMLRQDIVDAVAAGEFAVWPAATVAECISVLIGAPAGSRDGDGRFAVGDLFRRVDDRLRQFHELAACPHGSMTAALQ